MNAGRRDGNGVAPVGHHGDRQQFADHVERLLDQPGGLAIRDRYRAMELLRAAVPYDEAQSHKDRVAVALSSVRARGLPRLLRPVAVASVLLGFGAAASAAIWPWPNWVAQTVQNLLPIASPVPGPASGERLSPRNRHSVAARDTTFVAEPETVTQVEERDLALASNQRRETPGRNRARRGASAALVGEDTSPVLAAMRALRRDHDPVHARSLLTGYLQQHPNGSLAEEALAMSIEAAVAHQDADVATLAQSYLRTYPSGPFRALANRNLTGSR